MNLFGVGTWELLVIIVGALIIFGPGKLPEVMGQVGRAVRDFRRMTSELTSEFERTVGDPNEIKRALTGELDSVKATMADATSTVKRDLNQVSTTVGKTVSGAAKSVSSTTTKATSTTTKSTTTKGTTTTAAKSATAASTGAKSAATGGAKATASVPAPPKATKADPLADVLLFEPEVEAAPPAPALRPAAQPATQAPVVLPGAKPAGNAASAPVTANGSGPKLDGDALTRARQRRQAASYGPRGAAVRN